MRRRYSLVGFALCSLAIVACDTVPRVALLSPGGNSDTSSSGGTRRITIIPSRVQLAIGTTYQLTTDAPFGLEASVQWRSLTPTIAAVTTGGVVTGISAGTATIMARYSFDTTITALATVVVSGP